MKILIACEYSGIVRDAFTAHGHDAWSCDILPTESPGNHIQGDVLDQNWDMMIAFPPCTHLSVSGAMHFKVKSEDGRQAQGIDFFMSMINAPIERIAIENPVGIMSTRYRKADQIINPWQFGDPFQKRTCLWLKNLQRLTALIVDAPLFGMEVNRGEFYTAPDGRRMQRWYSNASAKTRSKTFPGIAKAMADQWGNSADSQKDTKN